jgi:hypothetical protein
VEWKKQGFIDTSDALHRVIASQGFSHRTNRKAHFFIQPSLDALDQFIRQKLILLHLECLRVLLIHGLRRFGCRGMIPSGGKLWGLRYERGT